MSIIEITVLSYHTAMDCNLLKIQDGLAIDGKTLAVYVKQASPDWFVIFLFGKRRFWTT